MSRPSRFVCLAGIVLPCWFGATADARLYVLRPDGTGDVPTFQAGVEALLACTGCDDTLRVEPGLYSEDVAVTWRGDTHPPSSPKTITCPGGPQVTGLRSLSMVTDPPYYRFGRWTITGLRVEGGLDLASAAAFIALSNCTLLGDVDFRKIGSHQTHFSGCTFRGRTFFGSRADVNQCHFLGATTHFQLTTDYPTLVRDCVFQGGDTAAVATPNSSDFVQFENCSFRDVGTGIVVNLSQAESRTQGIGVLRSRFVDVRGAAITSTVAREPVGGFEWYDRLYVANSHFSSCGTTMAWLSGRRLWLTLSADTVIGCRGAGIAATVEELQMNDMVIRGCQGAGAELTWGPRGAYYPPGIRGCLFERNAGDGLLLVDTRDSYFPTELEIRGNTSVLNGGAGMRLNQMSVAPQAVRVAANLVAGNAEGIRVESDLLGTAVQNDAWMNSGGDYVGVPDLSTNLTLDPQFCDVAAGDFHVAASSPCAPSGPYGQIGALGVGCDVMEVPLEVRPQPINPRSNAPVEAAISGHRLFDPRRVDPATVRLAGAAPSGRGSGKPATEARDVNQDGLTDLLLSFNARDLRIEGGEATLEGRTFDAVPFRGTDVVEVRSPASRTERGPQHATRLALSAFQSRGELILLLDLPTMEPAKVEVFDVAGRRVLTRELGDLGWGRHRLQFQERLPAGLYLLRLKQGTEAVIGRAVVLR